MMAVTTSDFDSILESVDEFLIDEHKIVTFEWLSQSVGIHVNLAKSVLEKYAENWRDKKQDKALTVVYSVGGFIGKNLRIILTSEECLPKVKLSFDKLLFTHIYSIQQKKSDSLELLFNASSTGIKKSLKQCNSFSGIHCPAVKERQIDQEDSTEVKATESFTRIQNVPKIEKAAAEETENKNPENKDQVAKVTTSKPSTKPSGKKVIEKPAIAAFFAKQQVKSATPVQKKETVPIKANSSTKRIVREPSDDEEDKAPVNTKRLKLVEENSSSRTQLKTKQKAPKSQIKNKDSVKKRKRIQQVSDSETSDEEKEVEDVVLDSPERPPLPVAELDEEDFIPSTPNTNTQNKTKQWVTKTHFDKDGYVVTSKEFVSCTNVEEKNVPVEDKKEPTEVKAEMTKPISPPVKKKQPSITNFFSRK